MSQPKRRSNTASIARVTVIVALIGCAQAVAVAALNPDLVKQFYEMLQQPTPPLLGAAGEALATEETVVDGAAQTITPVPAAESETATPTPVQPTLCCLDGWEAFPAREPSSPLLPQGNCANIGVPELGVYANDCAFVFGVENARQRGVYGLSIPIQPNAEIQISIVVFNLLEGEFWLAFSEDLDPQTNSLAYAMTPAPGGVSVFLGDVSSPNSRYSWEAMGESLGWAKGQPWRYNFNVQFNGANVLTEVNDVRFASAAAPFARRMFIGYRAKPRQTGFYLKAAVENLQITFPNP